MMWYVELALARAGERGGEAGPVLARCTPRMLRPKQPVRRMAARIRERLSSDTSTMGDTRDREVKALTVLPWGRRPSIVVTTATGEATAAIALRNACSVEVSTVGVAVGMVVVMTGPIL